MWKGVELHFTTLTLSPSLDRVSLHCLGLPSTNSVAQASLKLGVPASVSQVLGLQSSTTTLGYPTSEMSFFRNNIKEKGPGLKRTGNHSTVLAQGLPLSWKLAFSSLDCYLILVEV